MNLHAILKANDLTSVSILKTKESFSFNHFYVQICHLLYLGEPFCEPVWDSVLCWPAVPAGETAWRSCWYVLQYIPSLDVKASCSHQIDKGKKQTWNLLAVAALRQGDMGLRWELSGVFLNGKQVFDSSLGNDILP
ncbi:hypothetical protein CEXT_102921 [Caerostris extrusa]|uniref:G-protein coupled receptors family 2 profile 1 domain-containing protein n=1 Tax=Caerostris extrusa TaxID=172846 RepID=A0AAV4X275_CAEEX|nr:hypothetical protein CEXT_102921 [Caerostris extrusa]